MNLCSSTYILLRSVTEQINRLQLQCLAGPSSLCVLWLLGLIVPNFRSLCHIPLTFNWSAIVITNAGTKCPHADNRFTLFSFVLVLLKKYNWNLLRVCLCCVFMPHGTPALWLTRGLIVLSLLLLSRLGAAAVWMSSVYERTDWRGYRQSCLKPQSCMCSMSLEIGTFNNLFFHSSLGWFEVFN